MRISDRRLQSSGGTGGGGRSQCFPGMPVKAFLKRLGLTLVALIVLAFGYVLWMLHPWVAAGQAYDRGHWKFGDTEFQVWQRKNKDIGEPFADGLFARHGMSTNQWQCFCFDIQDTWSPRIRLEKVNAMVVVYRDGQKRGVYDLDKDEFQWHDQPFTKGGIVSEPPGDWWSRKSWERFNHGPDSFGGLGIGDIMVRLSTGGTNRVGNPEIGGAAHASHPIRSETNRP